MGTKEQLNWSFLNFSKYFPSFEWETVTLNTVFENYSNCRIFHFWHFPPIFVLLKVTCLVTLFDRKFQGFKNSPKLTIFDIFNQLLSTQNVSFQFFNCGISTNFCPFKTTCLVTLFDCKLQVSKNSSKLTTFGIFNELLSTQNAIVARFARNVKWDFSVIFKHRVFYLEIRLISVYEKVIF